MFLTRHRDGTLQSADRPSPPVAKQLSMNSLVCWETNTTECLRWNFQSKWSHWKWCRKGAELTVGKKRMMFSTGLSAISKTRYLQRVNTGQTGSLQHDMRTSAALFVTPQQHAGSYLNVWGKLGLIKLASMSWRTHTMCVMPCVSRIGS